MAKKKTMVCPECGEEKGAQHIVAETEKAYFLGCGHTVVRLEPEGGWQELEPVEE